MRTRRQVILHLIEFERFSLNICYVEGYYFHNRGFSVFVGNVRGNTFSRNHTTLDPDEEQFWKFSWHEMAVYDLSAIIDYILTKTKQDKIIYVGHSQGSTILLALLSERPEYNQKISSAHLMATTAIIRHYNPILNLILPNLDDIQVCLIFPFFCVNTI